MRYLRCWKQGQWKHISFLHGMVFSQSLAHIVVTANLMPYLMEVLDEKLPKAAATANIQIGITSIVSIFASFLSDAYIGRYQIILYSTIINIIGLSLLTIAASFNSNSNHTVAFRIGLFLIACGEGGKTPMLKDFGADQLKSNSDEDEDGAKNRKRVVIWWCIWVSFGAFAGIILLAIVEGHPSRNQHWILGFGTLAIIMSIAISIFISGKPFYTYVEPCGSILTRAFNVFVAAFLKKHLDFPPNLNGLRFLEKAAIIEGSTNLCTITEVEETKLQIRMIPMWTTFLIYGLVKSLGSTFFLQQGSHMNRELRIKVPLPILLLFTRYVSGQITWLNKKMFKKFPTSQQVLNPTRRIGIGLLFGVLCCSVASSVEARRLKIVNRFDLKDKPKDTIPMSIFWLTPQFLLLGAMDGFTCNGINDFYYNQVSKSMKSFGPSFMASVIGVGSLLGVIVMATADAASSQGGRMSWIADTINKSHLDYFYQALTVLSYINLLFYAVVASKYTYVIGNADTNLEITNTISS
ncbi:hypothetical protein ACHQM5_010589 [Ranunculus cassubicifolius]